MLGGTNKSNVIKAKDAVWLLFIYIDDAESSLAFSTFFRQWLKIEAQND